MRGAAGNTRTEPLSSSRQERLLSDLKFAWSRAPKDSISEWNRETVKLFGKVLVRRGKNIFYVAGSLAEGTYNEIKNAVVEWKSGHIKGHLSSVGQRINVSSKKTFENTQTKLKNLINDLKTNPKETAPTLIIGALAAVAASGGIDGDGGVPDLDLQFGIGAHRSIFTHSVISGAVIETSLGALGNLIGIIYQYLPPGYDEFWDALHKYHISYLDAVGRGASAGIAYHLLIDGTLQPAAYHDLPVSAPLHIHQEILVTNAAAEGIDSVKRKSNDSK